MIPYARAMCETTFISWMVNSVQKIAHRATGEVPFVFSTCRSCTELTFYKNVEIDFRDAMLEELEIWS